MNRFEIVGIFIALLCAMLTVLVDRRDQNITRQRVAERLADIEARPLRLLKNWESGPFGL